MIDTGALRGDALDLLQSLPRGCAAACFFDPQHRDILDAMTNAYINDCLMAIALALRPRGHCFLWTDAYRLCEGRHRAVARALPCVDLIAWDNGRIGNGYRSRRRGDYLLVLQTPPTRAKDVWKDHGIPDRWVEEVERVRGCPHVKPLELTRRLIECVTEPGDLVVDPAASPVSELDPRQLERIG
jgi:site-specific DNA-methyltransferase (adenine-specific)